MLEHEVELSEAGDSDTAFVESRYSLHAPNKAFTLLPSPETQENVPITLPAQTGNRMLREKDKQKHKQIFALIYIFSCFNTYWLLVFSFRLNLFQKF